MYFSFFHPGHYVFHSGPRKIIMFMNIWNLIAYCAPMPLQSFVTSFIFVIVVSPAPVSTRGKNEYAIFQFATRTYIQTLQIDIIKTFRQQQSCPLRGCRTAQNERGGNQNAFLANNISVLYCRRPFLPLPFLLPPLPAPTGVFDDGESILEGVEGRDSAEEAVERRRWRRCLQ